MRKSTYCNDCNVYLHDEEALINHNLGKPHLKQIQRIKEDSARRQLREYGSTNTRTGMSYYELPSQYSERISTYHSLHTSVCEYDNRRSRSPRSRSHRSRDTRSRSPISRSPRSRSPRSRSPLNDRSYVNQLSPALSSRGGFRDFMTEQRQERSYDLQTRSKVSVSDFPVIRSNQIIEYRPKMETEIKKTNGQFYCEPCDTYCARFDVMQAHLSGKTHKKNTKQIARFACDLCLIEVSSAETLQTHINGMSHIKRAKVAEEAKKEAEYNFEPLYDEGEELSDLRQRCSKLERQNANLQKEVDQLMKFKKNCLTHHHLLKQEEYIQY